MDYQLSEIIAILERTPKTLRALLSGLSEGWTSINEGPDTWNAFDILGHFVHGELTDWIPRGEIILSDKVDKTFIPFDRFAQEKTSIGKSTADLLDEFEKLRTANLGTLKSWNLSDADLRKTGIHPEFGEVTLKELLITWAIHDMAHLAQITRVMAKRFSADMGPWRKYISLVN